MGSFADYLRRGRTEERDDYDGDPRRIRRDRVLRVLDEDVAGELDYSHQRDDRPSLRPIKIETDHPLLANMAFAGLRSAFREASIFFHRCINRD